jgi:tripeptide aminopeptidase
MRLPIQEDRLLSIFKDLVHVNSPSKEEHPLAEKIMSMLKNYPLDVVSNASLDHSKPNLLIRLPANDWDEDNPILLSAHMDTIEPTENLLWIQDGDVIKTDETTILGADDKTGIAIIVEILFQLIENNLPHPEIEVLFSTEEEIHLLGSKALDLSLIHSKRGIVLDSDGKEGLITHIAPSHYSFNVTITGVPAHAGMQPENGKSAILFASQVISKIPFGRIDFETTSNIGVIHGGKATNIVAESCQLNGEVRSLSDAKLSVISANIEKLFLEGNQLGYKIDYMGGKIYCAYQINQDTKFLQDLWKSGQELNIDTKFVSSGGGSDANILNEKILSMNCVVLSCGMKNPHTHKEQASLSVMNKTALWLLHFLTNK